MKKFLYVVISAVLLVTLMVPTAFAGTVYKSSYIVAGFPGGCGGYQAGGSAYGEYGGVILGTLKDGDIKSLTCTGEYDAEKNEYVVHYVMELNFDPSLAEFGDGIMFYIPVQSPIGGGVDVYLRSMSSKDSKLRDALLSFSPSQRSLVLFGDKRIMASFDTTPTLYYANANCQAVPITLPDFHGKHCDIWLRISDPEAVVTITGHENFLDTILFPFKQVSEHAYVVTFVSSIFTTPLVTPFFTLAISLLAIGLLTKFMR